MTLFLCLDLMLPSEQFNFLINKCGKRKAEHVIISHIIADRKPSFW